MYIYIYLFILDVPPFLEMVHQRCPSPSSFFQRKARRIGNRVGSPAPGSWPPWWCRSWRGPPPRSPTSGSRPVWGRSWEVQPSRLAPRAPTFPRDRVPKRSKSPSGPLFSVWGQIHFLARGFNQKGSQSAEGGKRDFLEGTCAIEEKRSPGILIGFPSTQKRLGELCYPHTTEYMTPRCMAKC